MRRIDRRNLCPDFGAFRRRQTALVRLREKGHRVARLCRFFFMKKHIIALLSLGTIGFQAGCSALSSNSSPAVARVSIQSEKSLTRRGELADVEAPESVAYDHKRNLLYVSVQRGSVPGDGSIAKVSLQGKLLDANFVTGLNDPKGIALQGDLLYVSNGTELVEIDLESGAIVARYTNPRLRFLNDVTVDDDGSVYVAEMFGSAIYRLSKGKVFSEWLATPELENPNGLLAVGGKMYVAAWGGFNNGKPLEAPPGRFLEIDLRSKAIARITDEPLGNLDGLQANGPDSFILSDWKAGKIYKVARTGAVDLILNTEQGVGDILFVREKGLLILPMRKQNRLLFYTVR